MTRARRSAALLSLTLAALTGCTDRPDPLAPTGALDRPSHLLVPDGEFVQLTAGFAHTCALRSNGSVVCWGIDAGSNNEGQTVVPADLGAVAQVSAGNLHTCAVTDDGNVVCWGDTNVPADLGAVTQVGTGRLHTCAVKVDRTVDCWGGNAFGQSDAPATRIHPVATFHASTGSVVAGEPFILSLENAHVPGYSGPVTFSYAFDCGDGSGYGPFSSTATATCPTTVIGTRNVRGTVRDQDGDDREYTGEVEVTPFFAFSGFLAPVRSDALNQVKAGQGVPIRFSLGGDYGLEIFGAGPTSSLIDCDVTGGTSDVAETATAGKSSLSYDPATQIYTYAWKTQKGWNASCRRLELQLADGQVWAADFHFSR